MISWHGIAMPNDREFATASRELRAGSARDVTAPINRFAFSRALASRGMLINFYGWRMGMGEKD
jgi:hypothetical protein